MIDSGITIGVVKPVVSLQQIAVVENTLSSTLIFCGMGIGRGIGIDVVNETVLDKLQTQGTLQ